MGIGVGRRTEVCGCLRTGAVHYRGADGEANGTKVIEIPAISNSLLLMELIRQKSTTTELVDFPEAEDYGPDWP